MMLLKLLGRLYSLVCRHEWIRERRQNGKLGQRCMKCMRLREHDMLRLLEWNIDYTPIEPAYPPAFPESLRKTSTRRAA
jgi:hypothetical protein